VFKKDCASLFHKTQRIGRCGTRRIFCGEFFLGGCQKNFKVSHSTFVWKDLQLARTLIFSSILFRGQGALATSGTPEPGLLYPTSIHINLKDAFKAMLSNLFSNTVYLQAIQFVENRTTLYIYIYKIIKN